MLCAAACAAQQLPPAPEVRVSGALALGAWSGNRVLDERKPVLARSLALAASADLSEQLQVKFDGTLYQFAQQRGDATRGALREAFVQWDGASTRVRLGPQIVAWGRADRLNPTDNVSARDYTSPFAVDETQRIGAPALSAVQELGEAGRLMLLAKRFFPSRGPSDNNETALAVREHDQHTEYALKFDRTGAALDWSLSYFRGIEKLRSLQLIRAPNGAGIGTVIGANRGHAPLEVFGADAATTTGSWGWRGELARLRFRDSRFERDDGRLSHWYGIVGVDTSLPHDASIGVQYFVRRFAQAPLLEGLAPAEQGLRRRLRIANNQFHRLQDGVTVRLAQRLWNDRIDYEVVGVANLREHDHAIRPRVNLRYADHIRLSAGADVYRGREESFFGSLRENTAGFVEVVFIF